MKALFIATKKEADLLCHEAQEGQGIPVGTKEGQGWTRLTEQETPETVPVVISSDEGTIEALKASEGWCFLSEVQDG